MNPLGSLIDTHRVVVCCGSGGVGKTTIAAALGLELAARGRRAVVVTIDPARRLADALGVEQLGNDPARLAVEADGELWALMLDTAETFDGLVRKYAFTDEQAARILANRFYRNIAGSLSGTQEYMAAERLHTLHHDPRFDVVIVDTPPTRNALDFLDAPGTLARFVDHPLFKLLIAPTRRSLKVISVATQPLLRTIGKVVGGEVLTDAIAFFQAFQGMETGFRERADDVIRLLKGPDTAFVLVASPRSDTVGEACYFAERLRASSLDVGAVVVNRATPDFGAPGAAPRGKALRALHDNLAELHSAAVEERTVVAPLVDDAGEATWVSMLATDVHDLGTLHEVRSMLFADWPGSG